MPTPSPIAPTVPATANLAAIFPAFSAPCPRVLFQFPCLNLSFIVLLTLLFTPLPTPLNAALIGFPLALVCFLPLVLICCCVPLPFSASSAGLASFDSAVSFLVLIVCCVGLSSSFSTLLSLFSLSAPYLALTSSSISSCVYPVSAKSCAYSSRDISAPVGLFASLAILSLSAVSYSFVPYFSSYASSILSCALNSLPSLFVLSPEFVFPPINPAYGSGEFWFSYGVAVLTLLFPPDGFPPCCNLPVAAPTPFLIISHAAAPPSAFPA